MNSSAEPQSMRLHFSPGTRAVRVRWLLEEIGVPYQMEVVRLSRGAHKSESYQKIHPLGKVPALEIDDRVIFESLGICLYLADRFPDADLAPLVTDRQRRSDYCTWMAFSVGTLEPAIFEQVRAKRATKQGASAIDLGPAMTPFNSIASCMDQQLAERSFLLGDRMTAADVMNGSMMAWAQDIGLLEGRPSILAWVANLKARTAYARAMDSPARPKMP